MDCSFLLTGLLAATTDAEPTGVMAYLMPLLGTLQSLLYVAVGLGFVIFVHELGHFLVAKACGVKCEKFYVGFDFFEIPIPFTGLKIPNALWKMQIGETEYGIGSLPLGGYVKMLGQDDDPRNAQAENERTQAIAAGTSAEGLTSGHSVEKDTAGGLTLGATIEKAGEALSPHPPADPVTNADPPKDPPVAVKTADGRTIMTDPRSYTAKSVPARMAIISAGVIMNAIFAVIFATIAYRIGVPEMPAGIGAVSPGEAAWVAGIEPGSTIVQFGRNSQPHDKLRYEDLRKAVMLNGTDQKLAILVQPQHGPQTWYEVQPVKHKDNPFPTIGVTSLESTKLAMYSAAKVEKEGLSHQLPKTDVPLLDEDEVIQVDGKPVKSGAEINSLLVQKPRGNVTLTVKRKKPSPEGAPKGTKPEYTEHQITVEARPIMHTGVVVAMGPVAAVRQGSPAETAGLRVGDQIETIDGQPVGDPLSLGQRLLDRVDQTVTIVVKRGSGDKLVEKTLTATPEAPRNLCPIQLYASSGRAAAEPLGIAFDLQSEVAEVVPDSPAAKAGLQPGDRLLTADFVDRKGEKLDKIDTMFNELKEIKLSDDANQWMKVLAYSQAAKPDQLVKIQYKRGDKPMSADLALVPSTTYFDESRALPLIGEERINQTDDWAVAFSLGRRETKEAIMEVFAVLNRLVTGRLAITNLSGPPGILRAAAHVASHGIPKMLIFLTMLSANLAVVNFLPIPVLDGGHMMFLAAEWIRGRPVDAELQMKLTYAGLAFLFSLMLFASAMDVGRFFM
jgi:regulator of sigma E protease